MSSSARRLRGLLPYVIVGVFATGVAGTQVRSEGTHAEEEAGPGSGPNEIDAGGGSLERIRQALSILGRVEPGRELLARARARWKAPTEAALLGSFRWGEVSRTDAVLTRHYNPSTGREQRERRVTVYLRRGQDMEDLVLDIAHELTHATAGPSWDPYDPELTPGKYIWHAIEGEGGEVDALTSECRVGLELARTRVAGFASRGASDSAERCRRYVQEGRSTAPPILKDRVRRDFYRVGKWRAELAKRLGRETARFPLLSAESPRLYSSTGHAPYPVALYREFEEITEVACENSRRRLSSVSESGRDPSGRSPAAQSPGATDYFLSRRCGGSAR